MSKSREKRKFTNDQTVKLDPDNILFENLPQEVYDVADRIGLKRKCSEGYTDAFVKNRLTSKEVESDLKYAKYIFNEPLEAKVKQRKKPIKKTQKLKLNAGQRKRIFKINKGTVNYSIFQQINKVCREYMMSILEESKTDSSQINFLRADYHGAHFVVAASKNPALIGIKGFVVQETKNTFRLVSSDNKLSTLPKNGTIFAFELNGKIFKISGDYMKFTSHQRSRAKIKTLRQFEDL